MYFQINTMLISTFFIGWTAERIYFYFIFNKTKKLPINLYTPINNTSNTPINTNSNNSNISNSTNISTFTNTSNNSIL